MHSRFVHHGRVPRLARLALLLIGLLLSALRPQGAFAGTHFADLDGHWAATVVSQATDWSLVAGYPDGTFRPDRAVSRAELIKLAVTVRGLSLESGSAGFADMDSHWLATKGYLQAAVDAGLIYPADYGTSPRLEPDRPITRQEVAVISARVLRKQAAAMALRGAPLPYTDVTNGPAAGDIAVVRSAGIMLGYPDGTFGADRSLTRAEAAAIAVRLLKTAVAEGTRQLPPGMDAPAPRSIPVWEANSWHVSVPAGIAPSVAQNLGVPLLAGTPDGTLFLSDAYHIWRIRPEGTPELIRNGGLLRAMAADAGGNVYYSDSHGYAVYRLDSNGKTSTLAANWNPRQLGVSHLCADPVGNVYAVTGTYWVVKIDQQGNVTTLAGHDVNDSEQASEGPGAQATIRDPHALACDAQGNVYIADAGIRRISPDGTVTWIAGVPGILGYADGVAAEAQFGWVYSMAADPWGSLWVVDGLDGQHLRRVTPDGHVYTVAGGGAAPAADGDGPDAGLQAESVAVAGGQVYVGQHGDVPLRLITGGASPYPAGKVAKPLPHSALTSGASPGPLPTGPVTVSLALFAPATEVHLSVDDSIVARGGARSYTLGWDASRAPGSHRLLARVHLPDGAWLDGAAVQVTAGSAVPAGAGPDYRLLTPADGSFVRGQVPVLVVGDGVELQVSIDGQVLAQGSDRILSATWNATSVSAGTHTLSITHGAGSAPPGTDTYTLRVTNE